MEKVGEKLSCIGRG